MIYFLTKRTHDVKEDVVVLDNFELLHDILKGEKILGLDKEFNGLNELLAIPLLTVIGTKNHQFVIDDNSMNLSELKRYENIRMIGHNIKIDIKIARLQGLDFRVLYDTMIAEQRFGLGSNRVNDLETTYQRRVGKKFSEDKGIRQEFISMNKHSIFKTYHIKYAANDIASLFEIVEKQKYYIGKFDYNKLLYDIEFPLIPILAEAELEGFNINEDEWSSNIQYAKREKFRLEKLMDLELLKLGLIHHKKERQQQNVVQTSLFPSLIKEETKTNLNKGRINYNSSARVRRVFSDLGVPVPTIMRVTKKASGVKEKTSSESIGEDALNTYLIDFPDTPLRAFIELLLEYKQHEKNISSFGEQFLSYEFKNKSGQKRLGFKNPRTNKVHTVYRQCMSETGRLQSGDAKNGFYNSQQIPALVRDGIPIYRKPFTLSRKEIEDNWWVTTCDLTGAEAVIMCAFAKDEQLYEWAVKNDDLHSPMATTCYRALYHYRIKAGLSLTIRDSYNKEYILTADFIVDKNNNKQLRTDFKTITFGAIYGASSFTIARALNVRLKDGTVILNTIKNTIPKTFEMVESAALSAVRLGYALHNSRTKSRRQFMVLHNSDISQDEIIMVQQKARNSLIQGTQADLLKEAMVEIKREFNKLNIPNCMLLQVHDELVWKHKGKEHGEIIRRIMSEVATKYLEGFTVMNAEAETLHNWTK